MAGESPVVLINVNTAGVVLGDVVELSGATSYDPDNARANLIFAWTILGVPGGSNVTLTNANTDTASFTPDVWGDYLFRLTVTDPQQNSSFKNELVTIEQTGSPPVSNAGPNQDNAVVNETVFLDGTATTDPDTGTAGLTYLWAFIDGPTPYPELLDATTTQPYFVPTVVGTYGIRLTTTDPDGNKHNDIVVVVVDYASTPQEKPVVVTPVTINDMLVGDTVTLDASQSYDPDSENLSFLWEVLNAPPNANVALNNAATAIADFVVAVVGDYLLRITVTDPEGNSSYKNVLVTTTESPSDGVPPVIKHTKNINNAIVGTAVNFDAAGSFDQATGTNEGLTYQWIFLERPAGSAAEIENPDSEYASLYLDVAGIYRLLIIVQDADGDTADDPLFITATLPNTAPIAVTDGDQTVLWGQKTYLNALGSYDPVNPEELLEYIWIQLDGPDVVLYDENGNEGGEFAGNPHFYAPSANIELFFGLLVVDSDNAQSSNRAISLITVEAPITPPTAIAIVDQGTVNAGVLVELDGSASYDDQPQQALEYRWYQTSGPSVELNDYHSATATFISPYLPSTQTLEFRLIVNDGWTPSPPVYVTVTVNLWGGVDPTAPDISLDGPLSLTLPLGADYNEMGASAYDLFDGPVPVSINGSVNTRKIGQYLVDYIATDSAGNESIKTRIVNVVSSSAFKHHPVGSYHSGSALRDGVAPDLTLMNASHIEGWLLRVEWSQIHLSDGVFSLGKIRTVIDAAASYGKGVSLCIVDSIGSPSWITEACQHFDYFFRGDIPVRAGLPWDARYQYYKRQLVSAIGAAFDGDANLNCVYFTYSAMSNGAEFHWRVDEQDYANAGYTYNKLLEGAKKVLDLYIEHFPTTPIAIECHPVFEDDAQLWADLYQYGAALIGKKLGAGIWWAASRIAENYTGNEGDAAAWPAVTAAYNNGAFVIAQTIGNFTVRPDRFDNGAGWTTLEALEIERQYFDGDNSAGVKVAAYEYWTKDLKNFDLTPYFTRYINAYVYPVQSVAIETAALTALVLSDELIYYPPEYSMLVIGGIGAAAIERVDSGTIYLHEPWPYATVTAQFAVIIPLNAPTQLDNAIAELNNINVALTARAQTSPPYINITVLEPSVELNAHIDTVYQLTLTNPETTLTCVTRDDENTHEITLIITQGTGNNTVLWEGVTWPNATPPLLASGINQSTRITLHISNNIIGVTHG